MTSRSRTVTILAVLAFVAFLLYSTLSSQRYECPSPSSSRAAAEPATFSAATDGPAAAEQARTAAVRPLARRNGREHRPRPPPAGQPPPPHPLSERVPRVRFPHPLALLVSCILLAAALTWILPAGSTSAAKTPPPAGTSSSRAPTLRSSLRPSIPWTHSPQSPRACSTPALSSSMSSWSAGRFPARRADLRPGRGW